MSAAGPGGPARFALVGTGYRAGMLLRLARRLPQHLHVTAVLSRDPGSAGEVTRRFGPPVVTGTEGLLATRPEFVVTTAPPAAGARLVPELVAAGAAVLAETPPGADVAALRRLWDEVGASGRVQVAEQYPSNPANAARLEVVRRGVIGAVGDVQVSSTQLHHAVALVRAFTGLRAEPLRVVAVTRTSPLANPVDRGGWTGDTGTHPTTSTVAVLDAGDGRGGLYDFTETQTRNPLRARRLVVRGGRGEITDDRVVRLVDATTVVESTIVRRQTGLAQDVQGFALDHLSLDGEVLHRNPFPGERLSDEEIAVATVLTRTAAWARGAGPAPYPLAAAAQDQLVAAAITEAAATGRAVTTTREAWAAALGPGDDPAARPPRGA
ncbi:Gfo/Idh/MocA family oxidoreductase [Kineococcus esterisolvens]|uniref:Gfo/Idh/MocA family oxidoreductase n=1 Tax=unclassified Kineococcus TaxID=2621656 RepID=UPI003D7D5809